MKTIYDWFGYDTPITERYKLIKKSGFDGVLMWWSNGFGRDIYGKDNYRLGPELARKAGLFIENIHLPVDNEDTLFTNTLEGETLFHTYSQCVSDCVDFDIPTMVLHLPGDRHGYTELGIDRLKKLTDKAERLGVNIALENLHNLNNLKEILNQIDSKHLGFCYDCGHHYSHYPKEDLLALFASRMMALHLHDNNGSSKQHGIPLDGTIDWQEVMRRISEVNYHGPLAIEAMNWDYEELSLEMFLHKAFISANKLDNMRRLNSNEKVI